MKSGIDSMTEKRFRSGFAKYDEFSDEIVDELTGKHYFDSTKDDYVFSEEIVDLLNELYEEKEYWKGNACNNSNFINILLHELDIAQKEGYEVSDPFEKLIEKKS